MQIQAVKNTNIRNFRQNTNSQVVTKTEPYQKDSVEISQKKVDTKTKIKNGLIAFSTISAAYITALIVFAKKRSNKIAKLYKEKLVLSNLPEKLEFNEFRTLEEGIKYAKEVLGIKKIDDGFTIEAINTAIKGLIDVSNANKGKVFMPKRLGFESSSAEDRNYLAYVNRNIQSPRFGDLVINKDYFDDNILKEKINKELFYDNGKKIYDINPQTGNIQSSFKIGSVYPFPKGDVQKLIEKYYENPANLSIKEKQILFYSIDYGFDAANTAHRNPIVTLKDILRTKSDFLNKHHLEIDIAKAEKMSTKEQVEYLKNLVQKLEDKGSYLDYWFSLESPACIIHHEMGHLQDYAKNLKELDFKRWNFSLKRIWNSDTKRSKVRELENRWGSVWKKEYKKLLNENPDKFKKELPDFYEFITDQQIQQTAGKVSAYAQSGIGEYIAEVYSQIIGKKTIPEDVMALYKKYKGPDVPMP